MEDSLLNYYERELTFIREMGAEFAKKYPKIAGRLQLEPDKCDDPHTERLIEAFAFLAGRIHKKLEDDFPEITESLLSIIYPHYIRPVPSMSIVRFDPIKQTISPVGYQIDKNTMLYAKSVGGIACQFTTSYPVRIWPVEVASAGLADPIKPVRGAQQVIFINLKTFNNLKVSDIKWDSLRFFLNGPHQHVFHLYELLFNHVCHIECEAINIRGKKETIELRPDDIAPVGFNPEETILPYSKRSFPGYIQLFEYFCFPEKFLFFDLKRLKKLQQYNLKDTLEIRIYINSIAKSNLVVNKDTFSTNSTPAVNLFRRIAEPIRVEQEKTEYRVVPDVRRQEGMEIYSIESVTGMSRTAQGKEVDYRPFYSIRHHLEEDDSRDRRVFWHVERHASGKKGDNGTEVYLSFADLNFNPADPGVETLTVHVTCTNRDIPVRLPAGDPTGDFSMETAAPVTRINSLIKPTPTRRPSLGGALQWRLISHLSLNYLSIVQGGEEALREILSLYDFDNSPSTRQQINGIVSINSEHVTKRMGQGFCRGVQVTIEFDEDKFVGTGLYLFASVLERFLAQYVSVNSFSRLIAKTVQKKEAIKQWPPRNGNRVLL
ncbi:Type VI secretion system protein TssF [uncultured Desulfobacterium sp.]|uniref:Type VI secretion system protein TssF n=1 Tax=uncultured Desulfobacterium sp. TaxID=201089 RepID=A0A445MTY7_9BACT|nr:Type VI secretion system protein TssF [uncultured Desulfobacterium sp.]